MSKKPLLTIGIPAYNVELYLEETILSIAKTHYQDLIEILIVNDGSTDNTLNKAQQLASRYSCVKVIDKANGGHGSAINTALKHATGKYFRLLDGDDWFNTAEFDQYIEKLKNETADIVFTDLIECFIKTGLNRPVTYYSHLQEYSELSLDNISFPEWGPMLPTTTIKTKVLKDFNLKIDEKCFYVDQEYNMACYLSAKTATYYPFMIYCYRLEREGQSMEKASLIKNVKSHEQVCSRLLSVYKKHKKTISPARKKYLSYKVIVPMCHMQYMITTEWCKSRKHFLSFDNTLKKYTEFYHNPGIAGTITNFHRHTKGYFVKFTNLINNYAKYKNSQLCQQSKFFKILCLAATVIILNVFIVVLYKNTTLISSQNIYNVWEDCTSIIASFKTGFLQGLASFNNYLVVDHNLIILIPIVPFLILFGLSKIVYLLSLFNIYTIIPALLLTSVERKILNKFKKPNIAKHYILLFLVNTALLSLIATLSTINPFCILTASFIILFLIHTKLECIRHYIILALLSSLITFVMPSLLPFTVLFYILLFIFFSLLNLKKFHRTRTYIVKTIKLLAKFIISFACYLIILQIA